MATTPFTIRDCEFSFGGSVSIGASEITVDIESDGASFDVTHVWADGLRADAWLVAAMKHWVSGDITLGRKSRVRRAYEAKRPDDGQSYVYTAPRDHRSIFGRAA